MTYFGEPIDALERLAGDIEASAEMYSPEVCKAMRYLANEIFRINPLYEVICMHCEEQKSEHDVEAIHRKLTAYQRT